MLALMVPLLSAWDPQGSLRLLPLLLGCMAAPAVALAVVLARAQALWLALELELELELGLVPVQGLGLRRVPRLPPQLPQPPQQRRHTTHFLWPPSRPWWRAHHAG